MAQQEDDPTLVAMMRCYLSQPRIAWPWLALLLAALAVVAFAPVFIG